jgi:hypothetical protein
LVPKLRMIIVKDIRSTAASEHLLRNVKEGGKLRSWSRWVSCDRRGHCCDDSRNRTRTDDSFQ